MRQERTQTLKTFRLSNFMLYLIPETFKMASGQYRHLKKKGTKGGTNPDQSI